CYLTVSSTAGGSVTDPGEGVFPCDVGAVVTLVARPDEGYQFVRWTGDAGTIADVEAAQTTITMEGNYSITADFELIPAMYSLAISSTVGGSATEPGEGIFVYPVGTVVTLVADTETGYRFVNWTGDVGTIADVEAAGTTIAMNGSYSVTANFELIQGLYSLTISSGAGGSVTEPGEGIFIWTAGTVVTLVAQPEEGSQFRKWIGDVGTVAGINAAQTTVTMYDSYSVTASFDTWHPEPVALLTISSTEGGSVTTPGQGTFPYALGSTVTLAVEAESGYRFASWSGDVGTIADVDTPSTTIVTDSSYSIVAGFERVPSRCCTATAAYGTPVAQELGILRQFRDEYLLTNPVGQALAALYYKISPSVAEFITTHPDVKPVARAGLLPAVAMSTVVLNTTLADNVALGGLWALALAALTAWAIGRRGWRTGRI
ncbi:MAG: CFI-box-CTERM domain-containing protein, partial [Dehalococcoidia bacterium]